MQAAVSFPVIYCDASSGRFLVQEQSPGGLLLPLWYYEKLYPLICKERPQEAMAYNGLVQSWPEITRLARAVQASGLTQGELLGVI